MSNKRHADEFNIRKIIYALIAAMILFFLCISAYASTQFLKRISRDEVEDLPRLPLPELSSGERGKLGIDASINEATIDNFLFRSDSVYRDMRMLKDPANYEAIGGDSYLSGYVDGFNIIPLPYLAPVSGLPEQVGETYVGDTLFSVDENGEYVPNYEESMALLNEIFPKSKYIFLMCGGGGYAGMTKNMLVSLGWNADRIYNVGGFWYYEGEYRIDVPKNASGEYDYSDVPYYEIDFSKLTKIEKSADGGSEQ